MIPKYSKLLISELILPSSKCPLPLAGLDFAMMMWHSGMEREEEQWRKILASEGLKLINVYHNPRGDGAVLEAIRDDQLCNKDSQPHDKCRLFPI